MDQTTSPSLFQASEYFLTSLEAKGRSPNTLRQYESYLRLFREFAHEQGVENLGDVTPEFMDAWAVSLRRPRTFYESNDYRESKEGTYSKHTIAGKIQAVKTFFRFCKTRGYSDGNPAAHLRKPRLSHQGRDKAMSKSDFKAMYEAAEELAREGNNPRDVAVFAFIADTGARRSEVANLKVDDLDLDRCVAVVDGKTGPRPVEFTRRTAELLRVYLDFRANLPVTIEHDYVVVGIHKYRRDIMGDPLTPGGISQIFGRLAKLAGVEGPYYPHSLRHLVGKSWVDAGINLELVRLKLGHPDIAVTAQFYANQDRARVQAMTEMHSLLQGGD